MFSPFTLHNYPFGLETITGSFHILSIDPGMNNLGITVLSDVGPIYHGIPTDNENSGEENPDEYGNSDVKIVAHQDHKFQKNKHNFRDICLHLKGLDLSQVKLVVLEKQLVRNIRIVNISKSILSFCLTHTNAIVIEISSNQKSRQFNCPEGTKGAELKKWEVITAYSTMGHERCLPWLSVRLTNDQIEYISELEGEEVNNQLIKHQKKATEKLDEGSTTILQYLALKKWLKDPKNKKRLDKDVSVLL